MPEYESGVQGGILPEGDYHFVVDDAGEKPSSKGNPMIELQLAIEHNGSTIRVFDNLVFTQRAFWRIDDFRVSTGEKLVPGQKVNFEAEDCIDRRGRCHLFVDVYEGKSRNKVEAYLPPASSAKPGTPGKNEFGEPNDIDF